MSRIDDLISELCPEGAEYHEIQSLFAIRTGYTPSKSDASLWKDGTIPWFRMEDLRENGTVLHDALQHIPEVAVKGGRLFPANSIIISTSATIGEHALITVPHLSNQRFTSLALKPEFADRFDMKFVYYYGFVLDEWCRNNTTTSSFASVDMAGFKIFRFPVPPLEVQWEIVRILDKFTQLEAELEAELEARELQYAFFRDALLTFPETAVIPRLPMGEVLSMRSGHFISASEISPLKDLEHIFPCFGGNGIRGYVAHASHDGEHVLIGRQGALSGNVKRVSGKFYATEHAVVTTVGADLSIDWIFHMLTAMNLNQYASKGALPGLAVGALNALLIPVPSLENQVKTAATLDKFDALVNDLSIGLPAELAARRQQYEYYRDRLLTFEEAAV